MGGLWANLKTGGRLLFLRPLQAAQLAVSFDQLLALVLIDLGLQMTGDWLQAPATAQFNPWSLLYSCAGWTMVGLAAWLVSHFLRRRDLLLPLLIGLYSLMPLLHLMQWLGIAVEHAAPGFEGLGPALAALVLLGLAVGLQRLLRWQGVAPLRASFSALLLLLLWLPLTATYAPYAGFWLAPYEAGEEAIEPATAPYAPLDAETLLMAQHQQLTTALNGLKPQRPGVTDLYFVAYAPFASETVFLSEVQIIRRLLEERFDAQGRALTLVNHSDTFLQQPLATVANLRLVLKALGQLMDPEEDVLVLYLTSHGSSDHRLAAEFGELPLTELTPESLARLLKQAGIRWQVVLVSACYGGGFLPYLEGENRFVAAAAAADRTSFGCGNDHDMTYFGNALFREQLSQEFSLIKAMQQAQRNILEREREENLPPSLPEFRVGEAMAIKWQQLSERLADLACSPYDRVVVAAGDPQRVPDNCKRGTAPSP